MDIHPFLEPGDSPRRGVWYVLSCTGDAPSGRVGHSCTADAKREFAYVIGGATPQGAFDDVHRLNIDTLRWERLSVSGTFVPRYEHAAFLPRDKSNSIYTFGGAEKSGNLNSIQVFDTESRSWTDLPVSGVAPEARTHHTSGGIENALIIYSGGSSGSEPVSDQLLHILDIDEVAWKQPPTSGTAPSPRHGHILVGINRRVYVHGGMAGKELHDDLHAISLDDFVWTRPETTGTSPSARAAHSAVAVQETIFMFGGMDSTGPLNDLHSLNATTLHWSLIETTGGPPPAPRLDHTLCAVSLPVFAAAKEGEEKASAVVEGRHMVLMVFGGMDTQGMMFDDCLAFSIET